MGDSIRRAEEKIEMVRGDDGKMKIIPKQTLTGINGWVPICEKNLPYELTVSFLLTADRPGIPQPIKLQQQHRAMFDVEKPISEASGKLIAQWAAGGTPKSVSPVVSPSPSTALDEATVEAHLEKITEAGNMDQLKEAFKEAFEAAKAAKDNKARVRFKEAKELTEKFMETRKTTETQEEAI